MPRGAAEGVGLLQTVKPPAALSPPGARLLQNPTVVTVTPEFHLGVEKATGTVCSSLEIRNVSIALGRDAQKEENETFLHCRCQERSLKRLGAGAGMFKLILLVLCLKSQSHCSAQQVKSGCCEAGGGSTAPGGL